MIYLNLYSCETAYVLLTSTVKTTATKKTAAKKEEKKPSEKDDQKKRQFEQYHDFSMPVRNAKPHQVGSFYVLTHMPGCLLDIQIHCHDIY